MMWQEKRETPLPLELSRTVYMRTGNESLTNMLAERGLSISSKLDEHIFATVIYDSSVVFILSIIVKHLQYTFQWDNTFFVFIYSSNNIEWQF